MPLTLTSTAFDDGGSIPERYTCDGLGISPPLEWSGVPAGTNSLALVIDDPDVPDPRAPKMTWVHWVLYNIPATENGLREGMNDNTLPTGTRQGVNDGKRADYGGPCPPVGSHRYFHRLYALDTVLRELDTPTKDVLERAMDGHILGEARLMGRYACRKNR